MRRLGAFAEDFYAAFGLGGSTTAIALNDLAGVGVAATKALEERTAELREENAALRGEVAELRARQAEMERRQAELERREAGMQKLLESVFHIEP
jgi:FtsZ-binding cell division protein ZapB